MACASASEALVSFNRYSVKKGETISTIAKKLKVNRTDLAERRRRQQRPAASRGE